LQSVEAKISAKRKKGRVMISHHIAILGAKMTFGKAKLYIMKKKIEDEDE
jgi:hypothetical protein